MPSNRSNPKLPKAKTEPGATISFEAIGTQWSIELYDVDHFPAQLKAMILARIELFDKDYSRFREDSLVTKMSKQAGMYLLPDDAKPLFDLYKELYEMSKGSVTPLIGQTLADAGYDAAYSLQSKPLVRPPAWDDVLSYDFPNLTFSKPALLDVGALGKGYLVDIIGELLETQGRGAYCIDAGGDMRHRQGSQTLQVGLEHPTQAELAIGVASIANESICGSAGNRRTWGDYHHIIDPATLQSPRHIAAVWVIADSTLLADALTTALFFMSPQALAKRYTFKYALVRSDYSLEHSADFPANFFN